MKKRVYIYSIIGLIIDIASKLFMVSKLPLGKSKIIIDKFFKLTMVHNTGGAWGIFSGNTIILLIISIIFLGFFIYFIEKSKTNKIEELSYGIIISGIAGNMIDRLLRGYVVDFFDFNILGYDYPVFNFADIFIVVGVILLIIFNIKELIWKKD